MAAYTIQKVQPKEGRKPFKVKLNDGEWYALFKNYAGLQAGMEIDAKTRSEQNGDYTNYYIDEWHKLADAPPVSHQGPSTAAPASGRGGDWETAEERAVRQRMIAMESAQRTAVEALRSPDAVTPPELVVDYAAHLYGQILAAGRGDPILPRGQHQPEPTQLRPVDSAPAAFGRDPAPLVQQGREAHEGDDRTVTMTELWAEAKRLGYSSESDIAQVAGMSPREWHHVGRPLGGLLNILRDAKALRDVEPARG